MSIYYYIGVFFLWGILFMICIENLGQAERVVSEAGRAVSEAESGI